MRSGGRSFSVRCGISWSRNSPFLCEKTEKGEVVWKKNSKLWRCAMRIWRRSWRTRPCTRTQKSSSASIRSSRSWLPWRRPPKPGSRLRRPGRKRSPCFMIRISGNWPRRSGSRPRRSRSGSGSRSGCCCCPRTPMTAGASSWRSGAVSAVRKALCLPRLCCGCTRCMPSPGAGRWKRCP